jgi:hypothetical protein
MEEQKVIQELEQSQGPLLHWLGEITVATDQEQKQAEDLLISARYALKEATEKRMELTRPLDEAKKRIIDLFKPYISRLEQGIDAVNSALVKYHNKKRIEAEAARLTALAEEAARIRAAQGTGEIIEPLQLPVQDPVPSTSRAHLGSVTYREDFEAQIVVPDLVPRDLCEPSMARIRARVKSGVTDIPGVVISRKYISATRQTGGRVK